MQEKQLQTNLPNSKCNTLTSKSNYIFNIPKLTVRTVENLNTPKLFNFQQVGIEFQLKHTFQRQTWKPIFQSQNLRFSTRQHRKITSILKGFHKQNRNKDGQQTFAAKA